MSRTSDYLSVKRPAQLPFTTTVHCQSSVANFSASAKFEREGNLVFLIGPTWVGHRMIDRKLTFSYEEFPDLDYDYDLVGEIEAGELSREEKKVYIFLEQ